MVLLTTLKHCWISGWEQKELTSISNSENKGIWKSWENGCRNAKYDCVAVIDSDLQYQPTDIINLYDKYMKDFNLFKELDFSAGVSYLRNLISKVCLCY